MNSCLNTIFFLVPNQLNFSPKWCPVTLAWIDLKSSSKGFWSNLWLSNNKIVPFCWTLPFEPSSKVPLNQCKVRINISFEFFFNVAWLGSFFIKKLALIGDMFVKNWQKTAPKLKWSRNVMNFLPKKSQNFRKYVSHFKKLWKIFLF